MSGGSHALPGREQVEEWLSNVRSEIDRVGAAIEPLMAEQARLREREALLTKLLRTMDDGSLAATSTAPMTAAVSEATRMIEGSVLDYVRKGVMEVLREHTKGPMHINDIFSKFVAKGYRVPGAGRPANLTAHLARCHGIVSPSRGFYALDSNAANGEQGSKEPPPRDELAVKSSPNTPSNDIDMEEPSNKKSKGRNRKRRDAR